MGDSPLEGGPWLLTRTGEPDPENREGNRTPSVDEVITQEVEAYNRWARSEYVGYVVEQETTWQALDASGQVGEEYRTMTTWETVDSCWGFDDPEYATREAEGNLPDGIEKG